ncbi:MAG: DEAD/DEAH box helicase [Chitinivibrionales bacterium]|nr:DEAD/DEAH box helicase [Chitinivibrionales bacterium]
MDALHKFHPRIAEWLLTSVGEPTDIQRKAWEHISQDEHVLITAPTGSGKTLAAFLWALNQLIRKQWPAGETSVIYISPLKALNNDIRKNLIRPLNELHSLFDRNNKTFPRINVLTRSGDTPQQERRKMLRAPPEILITTPESLNIMLSSRSGTAVLHRIKCVILDEIHAVVNQRRGTHLITAIDRIVPLSGDFQRIALSATVKPLQTVAAFVGGYTALPDGTCRPRKVAILSCAVTKKYQVSVISPREAVDRDVQESLWDTLAPSLKSRIAANTSTLIFTNSRRLCEKITTKINSGEGQPLAYAHHGSLSREIRTTVEHKLKSGELKAIVATNSLELGIDIGALDEVIMIQSPFSVSSAIQRIGRAGHQVGEASRGTICPSHPMDFVEAAVLAPAIVNQHIESCRPIDAPLDVLAQVIISMTITREWGCDELYSLLHTSYPYRHLERKLFDLVLAMLAGRYADSRIRELQPRIAIDKLENRVAARKGVRLALYTSGGMIPDRGHYTLRHQQSNARIGDLDEEFVWEAKIGDAFTLGTQKWRIEQITHNDVFVSAAGPHSTEIPFWVGESLNRDFHFSSAIGEFLEHANDLIGDRSFRAELEKRHCMDGVAAQQLIDFLKRQKEATGVALPHRHHVVIEHIARGPGGAPGNQVVLHTFWGGRVNRPFALALDTAWEQAFKHRAEIFPENDSVVMQLPHEIRGEEFLSLVTPENLESLLRTRLEGSGFFGARFRECAGRALLVTRNRIKHRLPLWMNRLRSQKLLQAVSNYHDFPMLLEAWRTCLQDEFDLDGLRLVLSELAGGHIAWSETHTTSPGPMAAGIAWNQINQYMYQRDDPAEGKPSQLSDDILRDVVFSPGLRPSLKPGIVQEFVRKRQRLAPGYAPDSPVELIEWVKERIAVPFGEWEIMLERIRLDQQDECGWIDEAAPKLVRIRSMQLDLDIIAAREALPRLTHGCGWDPSLIALTGIAGDVFDMLPIAHDAETDADEEVTSIIATWLQYYGPVDVDFVSQNLQISRGRGSHCIEALTDAQTLVCGRLLEADDSVYLCDSRNFEIMLRIQRADAVPHIAPCPLIALQQFLAHRQGLISLRQATTGVYETIEQLTGYPAPAKAWESDIFPARIARYDTAWLDAVMQESDAAWFGAGRPSLTFGFDGDISLLAHVQSRPDELDELIPAGLGKHDFAALVRHTGMRSDELARRLWDLVWAGVLVNDSYAAVRKGIQSGFGAQPADAHHQHADPRTTRRGFARWKASTPFAGNWYALPVDRNANDPIDAEENNKDRVRILLERYGILFRELLARESASFQWRSIFRTLRIMELSGEITSGYFFEGIPGPQFISHRALRSLQRLKDDDRIYWFNATDPASLCGLGLAQLRGKLPHRLESSHVVMHGIEPVLISRKNGKNLRIKPDSTDPDLTRYFAPLHHLLSRSFQPRARIVVETINNDPAISSPYLDALRAAFDLTADYKQVTLYKRRTT